MKALAGGGFIHRIGRTAIGVLPAWRMPAAAAHLDGGGGVAALGCGLKQAGGVAAEIRKLWLARLLRW